MKVDIVIITTRDDELTAVRERFDTERQRTYLIGQITTHNQRCYTIAIARSIAQGNDASQSLAHRIIQDLDPQLILLVGTAGGIPHNEFTLGDVVIPTLIVNANISARNVDGTTEYMTTSNPLHPLVEHIISLLPGDPQLNCWNEPSSVRHERPDMNIQQLKFQGNEEWQQRLDESLSLHFGQDTNRHRLPLFKTGPIISSNLYMRDPVALRDLLRGNRSALAVEMEAAGVHEAARRLDRIYPVMVIRGISDIVGLPRDERWTAYACQTAAAFTHAFISTAPI